MHSRAEDESEDAVGIYLAACTAVLRERNVVQLASVTVVNLQDGDSSISCLLPTSSLRFQALDARTHCLPAHMAQYYKPRRMKM